MMNFELLTEFSDMSQILDLEKNYILFNAQNATSQ